MFLCVFFSFWVSVCILTACVLINKNASSLPWHLLTPGKYISRWVLVVSTWLALSGTVPSKECRLFNNNCLKYLKIVAKQKTKNGRIQYQNFCLCGCVFCVLVMGRWLHKRHWNQFLRSFFLFPGLNNNLENKKKKYFKKAI